MLGWILSAFAVGYIMRASNDKDKRNSSDVSTSVRQSNSYYHQKCKCLEMENSYLKQKNECLKLTFKNHMTLLADWDKVNRYAKSIGFMGAQNFFFYLAENHDSRFEQLARFLDKIRHMRNEIAHNGKVYDIDQNFLKILKGCVQVCEAHKKLPRGKTLYLNQPGRK